MENYERLANALGELPCGFPRTESGVELKILQKIFTVKEAEVAAFMTGTHESVEIIAERAGLAVNKVERKLTEMSFKGLIWASRSRGTYRLAPLVVGFWEEQFESVDEELAKFWLEYLDEALVIKVMAAQPPLERVVPAQSAISKEYILPYDELIPLIEDATHFELRECICRKSKRLAGQNNCDFPLEVCLTALKANLPNGPHTITKERALEIIQESEKIGLVHTVGNYAHGMYFICNCCGCCCDVLRGITKYHLPNPVAKANYTPIVDESACTGCGTCETRCQVKAITVAGTPIIDLNFCIGCGICVTGCPSDAIHLQLKPDAEIIAPLDNYSEWEIARLRVRQHLDEIEADHSEEQDEVPQHHHH